MRDFIIKKDGLVYQNVANTDNLLYPVAQNLQIISLLLDPTALQLEETYPDGLPELSRPTIEIPVDVFISVRTLLSRTLRYADAIVK